MRIRHVSIRNFRGIREMDWAVPDKNILCLIGRGDSTKSTILEALRRVFHSQWNLVFDDADFYQCDPKNTIKIEVVFGKLPEEFLDLETYGQWLCGWNRDCLRREDDPGEGIEDALRVRLSVKDDLEPSWSVIKNDDEGIAFKAKDRAKAAVSLIGTVSDRHLTWLRGSILGHLTNKENIASLLAEAGRSAKAALEMRRNEDLANFDGVAKKAEETARALGVVVHSSYKAQLDSEAINVRVGGLSLHDGEMPLRQLGMGSKRMLTTGLQKQGLQAPHITLFDEVEIGLEPHRIARLLQHLKDDTTGQYFLTTHSPVVVRELTVNDLYIVHWRDGKTDVVAVNKPGIADSIQGKIRSGAEAFLAKKVIVCEGATEVGFLRGLDSYWVSKGKNSFAYQGVALFDAEGANKIKEVAEGLNELAYSVGVLADSDREDQFSDDHATYLGMKGVTVTKWEGRVSIEERVFADLPWLGVVAAFNVAREIRLDDEQVLNQVQTQYGHGFNRDYESWSEEATLRSAIGKAANKSEWFKRQNWAEMWVRAISPFLDDTSISDTPLVRQLNPLRKWIDNA